MEKYKLSKPITFEGETITQIEMDLEGLTVRQLERAEREARTMLSKREGLAVPETNKKYLSCVAAKAAGVKLDLIKALNGKDYTQVCIMVQNFLWDGDSDLTEEEDETTTESSETRTADMQRMSDYSMESLQE